MDDSNRIECGWGWVGEINRRENVDNSHLSTIKLYIPEKQLSKWGKSWLNMGQQGKQSYQGWCDNYMLEYSLRAWASKLSS